MERGDKHGPRVDEAMADVRPSVFPATAGELLRVARDEGAPDRVVGELERLRSERSSGSNGGERRFANVQDVWQALGHGVETHRN
jgi:hypothetical protein